MMFRQPLSIAKVLVLPTLIGVQYEAVKIVELDESFVQHIVHLFQIWAFGDVIGYDLSVEHVQYRGKIELDRAYVYLRHVSRPFAVRGIGLKVPGDYIRGDFADLSFV